MPVRRRRGSARRLEVLRRGALIAYLRSDCGSTSNNEAGSGSSLQS